MSRYPDRSDYIDNDEAPVGGCISGFALAPAAVLLVGVVLASVAFTSPVMDASMSPPERRASTISAIFTPEVQYWEASILRWATQSDLDPNLIAVIMQIESCGDPFARSRAGAVGLFQVMPYHFFASDDVYSPDTNATRGMDYLTRALAAASGDIRLALAGYNGGISRISAPEWTWPNETVRYAYWGYGIYADAVGGAPTSARLVQWLEAGGRSLCAAARNRLQIGT